LELITTITPERPEGISGQTLRVQPDWDVLLLKNIPVDERSVLLTVEIVPERHHLKFAEHVREFSDGHDLDTYLRSLCAGMIPILAQELLDGRLR
jgi:hypothetical protein